LPPPTARRPVRRPALACLHGWEERGEDEREKSGGAVAGEDRRKRKERKKGKEKEKKGKEKIEKKEINYLFYKL
jgi:hypothetical protein